MAPLRISTAALMLIISTLLATTNSFTYKPSHNSFPQNRHSFVATKPQQKVTNTVHKMSGPESDPDPTKVWYASLANGIQNILTNSPLIEGKKAVVKMLAGDYDEAAVREKLVTLTETRPVIMMSFTK